jgi:hypothetical protein
LSGPDPAESKSSATWADEDIWTWTWTNPPDSEWERVQSDPKRDWTDFVDEMRAQGITVEREMPCVSSEAHRAARLTPELLEADSDQRESGEVAQSLTSISPENQGIGLYVAAARSGDDNRALEHLAAALSTSPALMWHPLVRNQLLYLRRGGDSEPRAEWITRCNQALVMLLESWTKGMTGRIFKARRGGRRGQSLNLFPAYDEATTEGRNERQQAAALREAFEILRDLISEEADWRVQRDAWRQAKTDENRRGVVEHVFCNLQPTLMAFAHVISKTQENSPLMKPNLEVSRMHEAVRKGLEEPQGRNPSERVAREFLALFRLRRGGEILRLKSSLIRSTLRTLKSKDSSHELIGKEQVVLPDGTKAIRYFYRFGLPSRTRKHRMS